MGLSAMSKVLQETHTLLYWEQETRWGTIRQFQNSSLIPMVSNQCTAHCWIFSFIYMALFQVCLNPSAQSQPTLILRPTLTYLQACDS